MSCIYCYGSTASTEGGCDDTKNSSATAHEQAEAMLPRAEVTDNSGVLLNGILRSFPLQRSGGVAYGQDCTGSTITEYGNFNMRVSRTKFFFILATVHFGMVCFFYFLGIGDISMYPDDGLRNRPGNINDHFVYTNYGFVTSVESFSFMDNNYGMYWMFSGFDESKKQLYAHLVNMLAIVAAATAYFRICRNFNLPLRSALTFFLNTSLIYFSILINKDALTIAIILWCILFAVNGRTTLLLFLLVPALIVRQQLAFMVVSFYIGAFILNRRRSTRFGTIVSLCVCILCAASIIGAILVHSGEIISNETLGEGLTGRLMATAMQSPILAPFGVPVRFLLYIYDIFLSFDFIEDGVIDAAKILRLPALIYITKWEDLLQCQKGVKIDSGPTTRTNSAWGGLHLCKHAF